MVCTYVCMYMHFSKKKIAKKLQKNQKQNSNRHLQAQRIANQRKPHLCNNKYKCMFVSPTLSGVHTYNENMPLTF